MYKSSWKSLQSHCLDKLSALRTLNSCLISNNSYWTLFKSYVDCEQYDRVFQQSEEDHEDGDDQISVDGVQRGRRRIRRCRTSKWDKKCLISILSTYKCTILTEKNILIATKRKIQILW